MKLIITTDIFGKTEHLTTLCNQFAENFDIVSPYSDDQITFLDESDAYQYFMSEVGVKKYSTKLENVLSQQKSNVNLIGFSAGASAIWEIAHKLSKLHVNKAVGFYGSQIRHKLDQSPSVQFDLVLPNQEASFDINIFHENLADKPNLTLHQTKFGHGFMNRLSENFNSDGMDEYVRWLKEWA